MLKRQQYFYLLGGMVLGLLMNVAAISHSKTAAVANPPPVIAAAAIIPPKQTQVAAAGGKILHLPILMYHHVGELPKNSDPVRIGLTVAPEDFAQQIQWLFQNGYHAVSLADIYKYSRGQFTMPSKPVAITFDDGYDDAFVNAVPILKQYNFVGSFGIITNNPGTSQGTNVYESWQGIQGAQTAGMEITCHTENHFDGSNPKFTAAYILQNLTGCKQALASHGINTNILVYPYGHYTPAYLEQAKTAGFVLGVTTNESDQLNLNSTMTLPRVRVKHGEDLQQFEDIILDKLPPKVSTSGHNPTS